MISFNNAKYFGYEFAKLRRNMECSLIQLLLRGLINFDGSIDVSAFTSDVTISHVWFYIYYLWRFNHRHVEEFRNMSYNTNVQIDKPSPEKFLIEVKAHYDSSIREYVVRNPDGESGLFVTRAELATFVNNILRDNTNVRIPGLEQLFIKMEIKLEEKMNKLSRAIGKADVDIADKIDSLYSRSMEDKKW